MLRAFSTAATGMTAQQMIVDTIANNLANMNTAGFKRSMIDFQDLVYVRFQEPGREAASGIGTNPSSPGGLRQSAAGPERANSDSALSSGRRTNQSSSSASAIMAPTACSWLWGQLPSRTPNVRAP